MAFHLFRWLTRSRDTPEPVTETELQSLVSELSVRELAFQSCINLVANAVSKCEVKTFLHGQEQQGAEWYRWNIAPNKNQNSTAFWHKLIQKMYRDGAALVVEYHGDLLVADSWQREKYALYDDRFYGVTVEELTFQQHFYASDVLFFECPAENVTQIIARLYTAYSRLIACGMTGYQKSRGEKGILELDTNAAGDSKFQEAYETIKNDGFRRFADADNAVMPLYRGMKYVSLASKTYNSDTTRDIRAMIDDVTDFTARSIGIPASLMNGSVQDVDSATGQFLSFCIDPLTDTLQEEINRKRYGKTVLHDCYVVFDTRRIKHIDLLDAAGGVEKLISSGVVCVNDIRALLGQPLIQEPWAWSHFITKNYAAIVESLAEKGDPRV